MLECEDAGSGSKAHPVSIVFGSTGLIGSNIVRMFSEKSAQVIGISSTEIVDYLTGATRDRTGDPDFWSETIRSLNGERIRSVVLAATAGSDKSPKEAHFAINKTLGRFLEALIGSRAPIDSIVFCSSALLSDYSPGLIDRESDFTSDLSDYLKAKSEFEWDLFGYARALPETRVTVLRIATTIARNVRGARDNLLADVRYAIDNGQPLIMKSSGEDRRSFIDISDVSRAIDVASSPGPPGYRIRRVEGREYLRVKDFLRIVSATTGLEVIALSGAQSQQTSSLSTGTEENRGVALEDWSPDVGLSEMIINSFGTP